MREDAALAFTMGLLVGLAIMVVVAFLAYTPIDQRMGEKYCNDFAPIFKIHEDFTWECVAE